MQKSSFNEYIKGLYNSCVYYIKNVESFYQKEQDKFEALDYWACSPKTEMIPAWCQAAVGKKEIVRRRLADVLKLQGIGCHSVELQAFSRKFKLSDAHYNYIRNVGDVCKSVHEGDFVKAERRMADLKRLRVNSAEKNVIAMLERRLNAFKNNPEGVEKARMVKDMEILLRNAFDELRGVMFG